MLCKLVVVLLAVLAAASAGYIGSPYYSAYTLRSSPYAYSAYSAYSPYTAYSTGYYSPYAYSGLGYGYGSYLYR